MAKGKRFAFVLNSDNGRPVEDAEVLVVDYGTTTPSTIYEDSGGVTEADNPLLTDSDGYYEYYADSGTYSEVITTNDDTRTLTGISFETPLLTGSKSYTPGTIPAGEAIETTVNVTSAALADPAWATFSLAHVGVHIQAQVNASGVVTVNLWNMTVDDIALSAGTLYAFVGDRVAA